MGSLDTNGALVEGPKCHAAFAAAKDVFDAALDDLVAVQALVGLADILHAIRDSPLHAGMAILAFLTAEVVILVLPVLLQCLTASKAGNDFVKRSNGILSVSHDDVHRLAQGISSIQA
jgi:hypothetical protein